MIKIITAIITFVMLKLVKQSAKTAYGLLRIKRFIKHSLTKSIDKEKFSWEVWLSG